MAVYSLADRHRAEVEAGLSLNCENLGKLITDGDRELQHQRNAFKAVGKYRNALKFAEILFGEQHVWTAMICGKLALALESAGKQQQREERELEILWARAQVAFREPVVSVMAGKERKRPKCQNVGKAKRYSFHQIKHGSGERVGSNAKPFILKEEHLTPRSQEACQTLKIVPATIQKRDAHSFYQRGRTLAAQKEMEQQHEIRRMKLLEELIQQRNLIQLEMDSKKRQEEYEERLEREKEDKLKRRYRNQTNPRRAPREPKPILEPLPGKKCKFKGAHEAATQLALEREIYCPMCGTLHDFKTERCRTCTKQVNWSEIIARSEAKFGKPVFPIDPTPSSSCLPMKHHSMTMKNKTKQNAKQMAKLLNAFEMTNKQDHKNEMYKLKIGNDKAVTRLYEASKKHQQLEALDQMRVLSPTLKFQIVSEIDKMFSGN